MGKPWNQEHYVITAKLAEFRAAYLAADEQDRLDILERYGIS